MAAGVQLKWVLFILVKMNGKWPVFCTLIPVKSEPSSVTIVFWDVFLLYELLETVDLN